MIRSILTNKWALCGIGFLIIFTGLCYFWYQHTIAPYRQQAAELDEIIGQSENRTTATVKSTESLTGASTGSRMPPTAVEVKGTKPGETGVSPNIGNDQQLFDTLIGAKTFSELTLEQQQEAINQFYRDRGIEPPEPGYTYYWDQHGTAHYHKAHEPIVKIKTRIGFAPTITQYDRYQRLLEALKTAKIQGNAVKVRQLSTEISRLKKEAQGEVPTGASIVTFGFPDESIESAKQRGIQKATQKLENAYKERNLQHLRTKF